MIFGGSDAYKSKCRQKLIEREVNTVEPRIPTHPRWYDPAISFDHSHYPDYVPFPGRFPLVVNPIVAKMHLIKVLMDTSSGVNIASSTSRC